MWPRNSQRHRMCPQLCLSQERGVPVQWTLQQPTVEGKSADKLRRELQAEGICVKAQSVKP